MGRVYLSQKYYAEVVGVHVTTVMRWRERGIISSRKPAGTVLIPIEEVEKMKAIKRASPNNGTKTN